MRRNMPRFLKEWHLRWLRMFSACVKGLATKHFFLLNTSYYDLLVDTKALWYWRLIQRRGSSTEIGGYGWAWSPAISRSPTSCSPANVSFKCPWSCGQQYIPWCPRHRVLFFLGCQSTRLGVDELPDWGGTLYSQLLRLVLLTSYKMRGFSQKTRVVRWEATCSILKQHWYTMCSFCQTKKYILTQFIVHFLKSSL